MKRPSRQSSARVLILISLSAAFCAFGADVWGQGALDLSSLEGQCLNVEGGGARLFGGCAPACTIATAPAGGPSFATYSLRGLGQAFGNAIINNNNLKFDAVAGSIGGSGTMPPATGAVQASCVFSTAGATEIADNHIEVLSAVYPDSPGDCADPQKCIQCLTTVVGNTCRFDCSGKVPPDEMTDADSFDITITFTHSFTIDHPGPPGMIRFDGFADQWTEFLPQGEIPDFVTTDGCNGGAPAEMVLNNNDFLGINDLVPESTWVQAFGIDDTSLGGNCTITTILNARMPLAGVLKGPVDESRGPIIEFGTICDKSGTAADCPAPPHP